MSLFQIAELISEALGFLNINISATEKHLKNCMCLQHLCNFCDRKKVVISSIPVLSAKFHVPAIYI